MKFKEIIMKGTEEVDSLLNSNSNHYKEKIGQLSLLLKDGKTDSKIIETLNSFLVEELLRVSEKSSIEVLVSGNKDGFEEMITSMQNKKSFLIKENFSSNSKAIVFEFFKEEMSIILKDLIKIKVPEKPFNSDITDEYISSYLNLISLKETSPKFSEKSLVDYLNFLEYSIKSNDPEEIIQLNEEIDNHVSYMISILKENIENCYRGQDFEELIDSIKKLFGWVIDPLTNDEFIRYALYLFKKELVRKVTALALLANKEVFPNKLEEKIKESKNKNKKIVKELVSKLNFLEAERRVMFSIVNREGLYHYGTFKKVIKEISDLNDENIHSKINTIFSLFIEENIIKEYLKKRNKIEETIKFQIQGEGTSYTEVKDKIESSTHINLTDEIILYFVNSVKLFQEELRTSMIGDLSFTYQEAVENITFFNKIKNNIKNKIEKELSIVKRSKMENRWRDVFDIQVSTYRIPNRFVKDFLNKTPLHVWENESDIEESIKTYISNIPRKELFEEKKDIVDFFKEIDDLRKYGESELTLSSINVVKKVIENKNFQELSRSFLSKVTGIDLVLNTGLTFYDVYKEIKSSDLKQEDIDQKIINLKESYFSQIASSIIVDSLRIVDILPALKGGDYTWA